MKLFEKLADSDMALAIESVRNRWTKAKQDSEDAQYLEQLIFKDYIRTVSSFKTAWDYRLGYIEKAQQEIGKKQKKDRTNLSYIETSVKEDFFPKETRFNIKIDEIVSGGYESYYWLLYFNIGQDTYAIQIPVRSRLTLSNMASANEGRFLFLKKTSDCCISVQFDDWTVEGLASKIKTFFNTDCIT